MKTYLQFKKEILKNKEVRRSYEALGPEFEIIAVLIKRRLEKGFTQQELAKRVGTKQSAISRLESGTYNPSLDFLKKVTEALGARIKIAMNGR